MTKIDVLERIAPPPADAPDWDDVLVRAGVTRHRRMRRARPAAAALAIAAAVAVAVLAWPLHGRGSVLDEALAALGDGPVTHVVVANHLDAVVVNPRTGAIRPARGREDIWYSPKHGLRVTSTFGGSAAGDTLRLSHAEAAAFLANDEIGLFLRDYRDQLRSDGFRVVREGSVAGQGVYWLARRVETELASGQRILRLTQTEEVAVSKRTFKPVYVRTLQYGRDVPDSSVRVLSIETTATMPRSGGATPYDLMQDSFAPQSSLAAATHSMGRRPLVPRGGVGGLRRSWIGEPAYYVARFHGHVQDQPEPLPGVDLYYGPLDGTGYPRRKGAYVSITEFASANAEVRLEGVGRFPSNGDAVLEHARATLRVDGLYVIVQASAAKLALAAVRALLEQP
jgi:hypothetical protein